MWISHAPLIHPSARAASSPEWSLQHCGKPVPECSPSALARMSPRGAKKHQVLQHVPWHCAEAPPPCFEELTEGVCDLSRELGAPHVTIGSLRRKQPKRAARRQSQTPLSPTYSLERSRTLLRQAPSKRGSRARARQQRPHRHVHRAPGLGAHPRQAGLPGPRRGRQGRGGLSPHPGVFRLGLTPRLQMALAAAVMMRVTSTAVFFPAEMLVPHAQQGGCARLN